MTAGGCKHRKHTPIVSKKQQTAMNIARAVKEGKLPKSKLRGASKQMHKGMTKRELVAHSEEAKGKKLPERSRKRAKAAGAAIKARRRKRR